LYAADGDYLVFTAQLPQDDNAGLYWVELEDSETGELVRKHGIVLDNGDERGNFAPANTVCRYYTKRQYDVATGQYYEYVVKVCR
jgi:hypothetical protein